MLRPLLLCTSLAFMPILACAQDAAPKPAPTGVTVGPATLDALAGRYRTPLGIVLKLWRQGDALMLQVEGQPAQALVAESESLFRTHDQDASLSFGFDAAGKPAWLVLRQGGRDTRAIRD